MTGREMVKLAVRLAATVAVSPVLLVHALKVPVLGKDRAIEGSSQWLALIPGIMGQYLRQAFLRWAIAECHPTVSIGFGTIFSKTAARLRANVYIGPYCSIGSATVEENVLIATATHVLSGGRIHGTDDLERPIREQEGEIIHVTIGSGSWIGAGCVVMADVGKDAIVAAGAVVNRPVPDRVIAGGVPAKIIRQRE